MPTITETTQIYNVYIKATPEAIWDAITNPEAGRFPARAAVGPSSSAT